MDDADLERKFKHAARVKWEQKYQQRHDPSEIIDACWQAALQFRSTLLAKPVATREEVEKWAVKAWAEIEDHGWRGFSDGVLAALSHFAPPRQRMMIEGMVVSEIVAKMREGDPNETFAHCARVAHRLATTPAPEADPDAEAKAEAWIWAKAVYGGITPYKDADDYWDRMSNRESKRNGWRAVASAKKEAGGG